MNYSSAYSVWFDAGHRYKVTITWEREGYGETDQVDWGLVVRKIDALAAELRDRELAKMLGPHHPSAYGIASFFMDRLKINVPVIKVEVHESDGPVAIIEHHD